MHQKLDVLIFFNICPKKVGLGMFFMFDLLPFFFPSFLITMKNVGKNENKNENKNKHKNKHKINQSIKMAFLCHGPLTFAMRELILPLPLQNPCEP
jgi:hypothetical protein